jgi:GAF domain-containing protein
MLLESLERFATTLTGGYGVGDVLHDLTSEITDVLDLTGAGVTLVQDGKQRFVTAAVEAIARLERVQEDHQRGPCVDAVTTAQPMTVSDLEDSDTGQRWPEYSHAAKAAGIRAVAGIPMLAEGRRSERSTSTARSPEAGRPRTCGWPQSSPTSPPATWYMHRRHSSISAPPNSCNRH